MLAWLFMPLLGVSTYRELTACCLNQNDIAAGTQIVQILSDLPQALGPLAISIKSEEFLGFEALEVRRERALREHSNVQKVRTLAFKLRPKRIPRADF